jgi:hypothetical protein
MDLTLGVGTHVLYVTAIPFFLGNELLIPMNPVAVKCGDRHKNLFLPPMSPFRVARLPIHISLWSNGNLGQLVYSSNNAFITRL